MARNFTRASSHYLRSLTVPSISAYPITIAAWAKTTDNTLVNQCVVNFSASNSNAAAGTHFFSLQINGSNAGKLGAGVGDASGSGVAASSIAVSNNTWHHLAGRFNSSTSREAILDGGNSGSDTTSVVFPTSLDRTNIGRIEFNGTPTQTNYLNGDVADAAVWSVALDNAEITALAAGVSPLLVRPTALVAYWPLLGVWSPEIELMRGLALTVTSAVASAHPRLFLPPAPGPSRSVPVTAKGGMFQVF
jgi:hypothetical protein